MINEAFPHSFGRVDFAKRAIAARGWGPLNYALLQHPDIIGTRYIGLESGASTSSNNQLSSSTTADISAINTTTGSAGDAINVLILEEMKNKGRLDAIRKRKAESDALLENVKKLSSITRITSGSLVTNNHHYLDENVREAVKNQIIERQRQEKVKEAKRNNRAQIFNDKYKLAIQKYMDMNQQSVALKADELHTIMKYHGRPGDSPIRKVVAQRRIQFEERKNRIILPNIATNEIVVEKVSEEATEEWNQIFDGSMFSTEEFGTNLLANQGGTDGMNCTTDDEIFCLQGFDIDDDPDGYGCMRL